MKINKILFSIFFLSLIMVSLTAKAQFQGQITMKVYGEDNGTPSTSELNLYATANRIMLQGENEISFSEGDFDASGLLIRNDKKDFVVMMGEGEALQFTKEELEGVFSMLGMMAGNENEAELDSDSNIEYTNKTRTINGYDCTELLISNSKENSSMSVWLTSGIDINWGMLAEPWKNVPENMKNSTNQLTQEFKSQNFPMLVQITDKGSTKKVFEVTNVNRSSIAKAMVEIPTGTNLIGIQEMIFKAMMGN